MATETLNLVGNPPLTMKTETHHHPLSPIDILKKSINLLTEFGYRLNNEQDGEKRHGIYLIKEIKPGNPGYYPRFHMGLKISAQTSQLEIASFHIDTEQHKSSANPIGFSVKNEEVKRLIGELEKGERNTTRENLLRSLRFELLFGNVREINGTRGRSFEGRYRSEINSGKMMPLRRNDKHEWRRRKMRALLSLEFQPTFMDSYET